MRKQRVCALSAMAVLLIAGVTACGTAKAPGTGSASPGRPASPVPATAGTIPGTPVPPATASPGPPARPRASAATQLAGFYSAATAADASLTHAAALVNEGVGKTSMRFSPVALAAVKTLSTTPVAHAIPAGMPPELLRRVLLAYSDLESRTLSLSRIQAAPYFPLPISAPQGGDIYRCLGSGAPAAARYDADMAAVRALAAVTPPVTVPAPDSRLAAELALRITQIDKRNSGCGECGGWVSTTLSQIIWHRTNEPGIGRSDGTIGGIRFRVDYHPGSGWTAMAWAC